MLIDWRVQFPQCFEKYPALFVQLNSDESECLYNLLSSTLYSSSCVDFIARAHLAGLSVDVIVDYLSNCISLSGLDGAIELFDLSNFTYNQIELFSVVANVFENPLAQTIFDARLRGFSDYEMLFEPLSAHGAVEIINQLATTVDYEEKIRLFFNFFARMRPFPPSQKYIVDMDVANVVTMKLNLYFSLKILHINHAAESAELKSMIDKLRTEGGNTFIYNEIKYQVASAIESEDLCSMRSYDDLMNEIVIALNQPQINLADFADDFKKDQAKRHSSTSSQLARFSFLRRDVGNIDESILQKLTMQ